MEVEDSSTAAAAVKMGPRSAWFEKSKNQRLFMIAIGVVLAVILVITVVVLITTVKFSNKLNQEGGQMTTVSSTVRRPNKLPYDVSKLSLEEKSRIDCFLEEQSRYENLTQYQCELRGCIYKPSEYERVPTCFYNRDKAGYTLLNSIETASVTRYDLRRNAEVNAPFGFPVDNIAVEVEYLGKNVINVRVVDPANERYQVPFPLDKPAKLADPSLSLARFVRVEDPVTKLFSFRIVRRSNNEVLFDTSNGALIYSDQYLQFSTKLPSTNLYGLGENNHESLRHDLNFRSWGIFARDWSPGWGDNTNNYGHQPAYYVVENSGKSHAVLLYNSNAMEYLLTPSPSLTMRTIGGIIDLYFVVEETPELVVQNYHQLIGLPLFPPYWSLGFQISRWGYKDLAEMKQVVQRNRDINIPQDVQFMDIDYMDGYKIFTVGKDRFPGLGAWAKSLREDGIKFVLIIDPGVVAEPGNGPFETGLQSNVFLKWSKNMAPYDRDSRNQQDLLSWCWPNGKISYPDFFYNQTQVWWQSEIDKFCNDEENGVYLDGAWIDMNEPASFNTNELKPHNWLYPDDDESHPFFTLKCPFNRWDDPPYRTKNSFAYDGDTKQRLSDKTICMTAEHRMGDKTLLHYDVHSLYGHTNAIATYKALTNSRKGMRPFSLTRSNFVGTGRYAIHWTGDNDSTWKHLKMSIIGILEFNFFGIPMVGSDICGFWMDVVDAEMCTRWLQLGAFYPYSRNHNSQNGVSKDPASYKNKTLEDSTREALRIRYTILPFMYTLFYRSHLHGGTVARPLLFEFPTDDQTFNIDEQFLLGSSFLVSPAVRPGQTSVKAYFPPASRWFDYRTGKELNPAGWLDLDAPLSYIPLHLRGGAIIPTQDPLNYRNTTWTRTNPMGLIVTLDAAGKAKGELFWDDGVSFNFETANQYYHAEFKYENDMLTSTVLSNSVPAETNNLRYNQVKILGLNKEPLDISLNGNQQTFAYDAIAKSVLLSNLNQPLGSAFSIKLNFLIKK